MDKEKQTLGGMIATLRKGYGMTQNDLAEQMNVTDKAVSKWERDISCPDVSTLPKLAEILGVSVDELLSTKTVYKQEKADKDKSKIIDEIIDGALKGVVITMGVVVLVRKALNDLGLDNFSPGDAIIFLGMGLFCTGLLLAKRK